MTYYCTYCSAEKNKSDSAIPAIGLYNSTRIKDIYAKAKEAGVGFVILSGKYGLVEPEQPIAYYDHLLLPTEVEKHSELVAGQLTELGVKWLIFHTIAIEKDPNLQAYVSCVQLATNKSEVQLEIRELA